MKRTHFFFTFVILLIIISAGGFCAWRKINFERMARLEKTEKTEEQLGKRRLEREQMFKAAREYIKKYSVEGMEVELRIIKQFDKWALLEVVPITVETDRALAVMEKVEGGWICRDSGTILPGWEERVPELFEEAGEAESEIFPSPCNLSCPAEAYELDKKKCKCIYQGGLAGCRTEKTVSRGNLYFIGCSCPEEYSLSGGGGLGYRELIDGVNKVEWLGSNTLKITAIIYVNCSLGLGDADYKIEGDNLVLMYDQTDQMPGEDLLACACPHEATYVISNLEKKDYKIKMSPM